MNNEVHAPEPQFVSRLEWELESAVRRQGSLNGTPRAPRSIARRLGTTLALVVVSLLVGGAGTHAVTHRTDKRAAALYVARAEALLEIARTRLDHCAQELAKTQALADEQAVSEVELRHIEAQYMEAESETDIRALELAETRITGKEPNDSLSAPLVDGRDFVTERMAARRRPMKMRLQLMSDQAQRHQELSAAGRATARELKAAQLGVIGAQDELAGLEQRIALRASFLAGDTTAAEVELQGMRYAAGAAREMALHRLEVLAEQHERFTLLSERGLVSDSEFRAVEAQLREAQAQVELADLEMRILDQKLEEVSKE